LGINPFLSGIVSKAVYSLCVYRSNGKLPEPLTAIQPRLHEGISAAAPGTMVHIIRSQYDAERGLTAKAKQEIQTDNNAPTEKPLAPIQNRVIAEQR